MIYIAAFTGLDWQQDRLGKQVKNEEHPTFAVLTLNPSPGAAEGL